MFPVAVVALRRGALGPGGVPSRWLSRAVAGCVSAASPEPFRSPVRVLFSVRTEALAVVLSGGLAAHRCRVGLLYGVQSRWALLYAVRIVGFAVRAGPSKASVRALCSTSFRLQSGGVGGRSRSTADRVRGGGADALSVPYSDGSAWSVTACDRVLFSTRWGCPRRYRFRRRCRFPRRRVAAVRRAVWRPACPLRCAPGCGPGVRFRSARAPLYERRFRSGSTPSAGSFRRAVARTRCGVPAVVVRRGERLVVVAAACSGGRRFHLRLAGLRVALALEMSHLSRSACPTSSRSAVASGLARRHVGTCDPFDANALAGVSRRLHPCARCVVFFGRCAQLFACGLVAGVLLDAVLIVPCVLTP